MVCVPRIFRAVVYVVVMALSVALLASSPSFAQVKGRGHWLMEEAPDQVVPKLVEFLNR
jgi:pimeloyl-ACP methyl ester carboxylesterase